MSNQHPEQEIERHQVPRNLPYAPLTILTPRVTTILTFNITDLFCLFSQFIQMDSHYILHCVWLILINIMFMRFTHIDVFSLFILSNTVFHCVTISQLRSVTQSCPTLCDPMNRCAPGLPVHHQLLESTQTHVHRVGDAIQPSHPLSSPSPPAPNPSQHQGLLLLLIHSTVAEHLDHLHFEAIRKSAAIHKLICHLLYIHGHFC